MYCVDSLFSFSCLSNTLSPSRISLSRAFLWHSVYTFPFAFLSLSRSRTSSSMPNFWRWGSLVLIRLLNNSSAGLTPVVECGVLRSYPSLISSCDPLLERYACASGYCGFVFPFHHWLAAIRVRFVYMCNSVFL